VHPDAGVGGDNDPLDVCEIGLRIIPTGAVRRVKVLGATKSLQRTLKLTRIYRSAVYD
jgi:inorganic pyrophosphatase